MDNEYYYDDPVEEVAPRKIRVAGIAALICALFTGSMFIQSTLAGNININSGSAIQFGQGMSLTTACSGSQVLTVTPYSSFINASGAGAHYFSSVKVSGIPSNCYGYDFTINAYGASSNTPLSIFNASSTSPVVYDNAGSFELGAGTTAGASIASGSGTFTLTFTSPVATSGTMAKLALQTGVHSAVESLCVQGITCSIGDVGPGGGNIFYYSASGFSCGASFTSTGSPTGGLCHYLEAAPSGSTNGTFPYAITGLAGSDVSGITNDTNADNSSSAIGLGYKNSLALISQGNDITSAPGIARAYRGGSKSDWYLPSSSELNQMCKWARGVAWTSDATICSGGTLNLGTGAGLGASGFESNFYWSSSERESTNGWGFYFNGPTPDYNSKFHAFYVRAIRAF